MRPLILGLLIVLVSTGMTCSRVVRQPVPAGCNAICFLPCTDNGDSGVRWEADPSDAGAWDALVDGPVAQLDTKLRQCDQVHRAACVQCLQRLDREGVITGVPLE